MTSKDYRTLASFLGQRYPHNEADKKIGYDLAINAIVAACMKDNPRFNREHFLRAVGMEE